MIRAILQVGLALLLSCVAPLSEAQECGQARTRALLLAAYPAAGSNGDEPPTLAEADGAFRLTAACKVWPAHPQFTLLAVKLEGAEDTDQGFSRGDLEVLAVANDGDEVRHRHREAHVLDGDAIFVDGISLDTAAYRLSAHVMAFGVRIVRRNMSQPNPFYSTSLRLYAVDDTTAHAPGMRMVLRNLEVGSSTAEWDTRCAGERSETTRTLAIDPARRRHGLSDLVVRGDSMTTTSVLVGAECVREEAQQAGPARRLEYDGETYRLPDVLQAMDDDYVQMRCTDTARCK